MKKVKSILSSDFDYDLPKELIAQNPVAKRETCRLLILQKNNSLINHLNFSDIINYLKPGDLLVLNNSYVIPAKLIGQKKLSGGLLDVFLHQIKNNQNKKGEIWEVMIRGRVKIGLKIDFSSGLEAEILEKKEDGLYFVEFNKKGKELLKIIDEIGQVPLPPYIKRGREMNMSDKKNYQTVFASRKKSGSVAAPTAGLHFSKDLLKKIEKKGINISYVTLHVGLGTFAPVREENMLSHKMHKEFVSIEKNNLDKILQAKKENKRIIAVGTTACRAIESLAQKIKNNHLDLKNNKDFSFWTDIFIYPGFKFTFTEALITNFHLPKSTLLLLVSALAGEKNIKKAYQEAIKERYRFFSYGDAMFIC